MEKETFFTPTGKKITKTYKKVFEKGENHLIETGETNTYEEIQSHKDECDIGIIITKLLAGDEVEAIRVAQADKSAQYGDGTLYNKSLNEVNMIQRNAENILSGLTDEQFEEIKKAIEGKVEEQKSTDLEKTNEEQGETTNE